MEFLNYEHRILPALDACGSAQRTSMAVAQGRYGGAGLLVQSLLQANAKKMIIKTRTIIFIHFLHCKVVPNAIEYNLITAGLKYKWG